MLVGGAADASIQTSPKFVGSTAAITANAGVTGGAGLVIPSTVSGLMIVIRSISTWNGATAVWQARQYNPAPNTLVEASYSPGFSTITLNPRQAPVGPQFMYATTTVSPATGTPFATRSMLANTSYEWPSIVPYILLPNEALIFNSTAVATQFSVDLQFDVYELLPS